MLGQFKMGLGGGGGGLFLKGGWYPNAYYVYYGWTCLIEFFLWDSLIFYTAHQNSTLS